MDERDRWEMAEGTRGTRKTLNVEEVAVLDRAEKGMTKGLVLIGGARIGMS